MGVGESDGKGEGESEGVALGVALGVAWAVSPELTAISRPAAAVVTPATARPTTTTILLPAVARANTGLIASITGSSLLDTNPAHRIAGMGVLVGSIQAYSSRIA